MINLSKIIQFENEMRKSRLTWISYNAILFFIIIGVAMTELRLLT